MPVDDVSDIFAGEGRPACRCAVTGGLASRGNPERGKGEPSGLTGLD